MIRVNQGMKADFAVWQQFLKHFNGVTVICCGILSSDNSLQPFKNNAGGFNGGSESFLLAAGLTQNGLPTGFFSDVIRDITFLELFPVYVSLLLYGIHGY